MDARRYLAFLAAAVVLIAGLLGGINWAVDPYLFFGAARQPGINDAKPAVNNREAFMKAYQASRVQARTVVLGSSRTDIGLDASDPAWPRSAAPVYNLSLAGVDLGANLHYLRHMLATNEQAVRTSMVVVGLDFENFLMEPVAGMPAVPAPPSENGERLAVQSDGSFNPLRRERLLKDAVAAVTSLDAVYDSFHTLLANRIGTVWDIEPDGNISEAQLRLWAINDGFGALFEQKNVHVVKKLGPAKRLLSGLPDSDGVEQVVQLLELARQRGLKLVLMVSPTHASRLELLDYMGYWPDYERWKRGLTAQVAAAKAAGLDVELWDFGGYDAYTMEPVPENRDLRGRMQWFWDPVHYSTALGGLTLSSIFKPESADYGVRMTPENIEEHLSAIRKERQKYRAEQPQQVQRLRELYCRLQSCEKNYPVALAGR